MNKTDEWRQLYRVFGPIVAASAQESERPDFLVPLAGNRTLGVEITSFFMSSGHAKLNHLPKYSESLIDRTGDVHWADRESMSVNEVTLTEQDGTVIDRVTAIIHHLPSPQAQVDMLLRQIEEKEKKASQYDLSCASLDLVVLDGSTLFLHKSPEDFYHAFYPFYPKAKLTQSPFREIYLLTRTVDSELVYIPLLANAFLAECYVYSGLVFAADSPNSPLETKLQLIAGCLCHERYHNAKACIDSEGIKIFNGAYEVYLPDGEFVVREWMVPTHPHPERPLPEMLEHITDDFKDTVTGLVSERAKKSSAFVIAMPTYDQYAMPM